MLLLIGFLSKYVETITMVETRNRYMLRENGDFLFKVTILSKSNYFLKAPYW